MPTDTRIDVPFLPQTGITQQILNAIQLANEHHTQQQQNAIEQQKANTQQQGVQQQGQLVPSEIAKNTAGASEATAQAGLTNAQTDAGIPSAQAAAANARAGLEKAQSDLVNATNPSDVKLKQIEVDRAEALNKFYAASGQGFDGQMSQARATLGKLDPTETALLSAAENATRFEGGQGRPDALNHVQQAINEIMSNRRGIEVARIFSSSRGDINNKDYLNTETNTLEQLTANQFLKSSKDDPGKYIQYSPSVANAQKAQGQINDIRDGIKRMSSVLNGKGFQLSDVGRSIMAAAQHDPTILNAPTTAEAMRSLTPQERDFFTAAQTLTERAMSLRALQGQGAGSDAQREAIVRLLPSLFDPDVNLSKQRLNDFTNNVDNVDRQIPKIGKQGKGGASETAAPGPQIPSGATMKVPGSDGKLHWSDGKQDLGVAE